jgi:hypothetical protein
MAHLPTPGSDADIWGDLLNEFLRVEHNNDGTLKNSVHLTGSETISGAKTFTASPIVPTPNATTDAANKSYVDTAVTAGTPDANATTKGKIQLANDLSGSAGAPQVVATHLSAALPVNQGGTGSITQSFVDISSGQTIGGTKTFSTAPIVPTNSFPETAVTNLTTDLAAKEATANKGVTNGYASLDGSTKVPIAQLPTGATSATVAIGNHTHTLATMLPAFTKPGALTISAGSARLPIDGTYTITGVRLMVNTAPTGASIIADVKKNGSTIFTTQANRPSIAGSANSGGPGVAPDVTTLVAGDYLTIDVNQVGSTVSGSDLVVTVLVVKTV